MRSNTLYTKSSINIPMVLFQIFYLIDKFQIDVFQNYSEICVRMSKTVFGIIHRALTLWLMKVLYRLGRREIVLYSPIYISFFYSYICKPFPAAHIPSSCHIFPGSSVL